MGVNVEIFLSCVTLKFDGWPGKNKRLDTLSGTTKPPDKICMINCAGNVDDEVIGTSVDSNDVWELKGHQGYRYSPISIHIPKQQNIT